MKGAFADILLDAWRSCVRRRLRTSLTAAGIGAGIAGLVAITALSDSSAVQIARRFDQYSATTVTVTLPASAALADSHITSRLRQMPGVLGAGRLDPASDGRHVLATTLTTGPAGVDVPVLVGSADGLRASNVRVTSGGVPNPELWRRDPSSILIGAGLARELGVDSSIGHNIVELGGLRHYVTGVMSGGDDSMLADAAVLMSPANADRLGLNASDRSFVARTRPGSAQAVAAQAPLWVDPVAPDRISSVAPFEPTGLKGRITDDTRNLLIALSVVTLLVSAIGIANILLVSVLERRREIGARRALGASRANIAITFHTEAALVGTVGGIAGFAVGIFVALGLAHQRNWDLAMPPWTWLAPLLGTLVGSLAGIYPAVAAAHVDPVVALRS